MGFLEHVPQISFISGQYMPVSVTFDGQNVAHADIEPCCQPLRQLCIDFFHTIACVVLLSEHDDNENLATRPGFCRVCVCACVHVR